MFGLGVWELLLILAIILLVFGAKRLPAIGEGLGKAVREFKVVSGTASNETAPPAENDGESPESQGGGVLPELDQLRRIKAKTDKLRRMGRWTRLGRF